MMEPGQLETLVSAVQSIASVLSQLGVPGLLCLALVGPVLIILAMLYFEHLRSVRQEQQETAYRATVDKVLETYRIDTQNILSSISKKHTAVVDYYEDNVELTRKYETISDGMQQIIVNNTRALERLTTIIESRGHV